jgi:hypothetical protein
MMKAAVSPTTLRETLLDLLRGFTFLRRARGSGSGAGSAPVKTWKRTTLIGASSAAVAVFNPQIALDTNDNALAVWLQSDGVCHHIWVSRYVHGTGWEMASPVYNDKADFCIAPQILFDAYGGALLVWLRFDGSCRHIWSSYCEMGGRWGEALRVTPDYCRDADAVRIAADASGNTIAAWCQFDGVNTSIWSNRFKPEGGWGIAQVIDSEEAMDAYDPQIAMDNSGNAIVVWTHSGKRRSRVWANYYVADIGWTEAITIDHGDGRAALYPQIAMDASGNAMVVWLQSDGTQLDIWTNRYAAGRGWGKAEAINTGYPGGAFAIQVVMNTNSAVVVWQQSDEAGNRICAARYTGIHGWGAATSITSASVDMALKPQITLDRSGNALVVWKQSDGIRCNVWSSRLSTDRGREKSTKIDPDITNSTSDPQIAMNANGNAFMVREQFERGRFNILANIFS